MATFTANYNLRKPAGGDLVTVAADINASMDIIDAELIEHETRLDALEANNPGRHDFIRKTANESVTSSTTVQEDNHLKYTFPETGTYILTFVIFYEGAAAGDLKIQFDWTGALSSFNGFVVGFPTSAASFSDHFRGESLYGDATSPSGTANLGCIAGNTMFARVQLMVIVTTVGTLALNWAQNTSDATATTVLQHSYVDVLQVV